MKIDIPPSDEQKLADKALAAGFDRVEAYVAEHVLALANHAEPLFAPLTAEELEASLAMCDRGMAEAQAGLGVSVAEARRRTHEALAAARK